MLAEISKANIIGALGYTSEILWHFFGRNKSDAERMALLKEILRSGSLRIDPPRRRENQVLISPAQEVPSNEEAVPTVGGEMYFAEPKMVSFADIPIHCLPIHAQRYQHFAFGFSKSKLTTTYPRTLRTVMLFTADWANASSPELKRTLLRKRPRQNIYEARIELSNFLKFDNSANPDESFHNIYLEREWRCIEDVPLQYHLEILLVPQKHLENSRQIVDQFHSEQISIMAWESLFGEEGAHEA